MNLEIINSLLDGFLGILFAGIFIWLFQFHYSEKMQRLNVYIKRREREEDEFYEMIKRSREGFHFLCRTLASGGDMTQKQVDEIIINLQNAIDFIESGPSILHVYKHSLQLIFDNYNNFSNIWNQAMKQVLSIEEYNDNNQRLMDCRNQILNAYDEIDCIYFKTKKLK